MFTGTTSTDSGVSLNTWGAYDANAEIANPDGKNGGFAGCTIVSE